MPAIDLTGIVGQPQTAHATVFITLPGGLRVGSGPQGVGVSALQTVQALIASANAAMAPLGPVFTIIDAILAIVKFATSVPEMVINPGKVIEAVQDIIQKAGRLASLVPQLSIPLMMVGVIDALILVLEGLADEFTKLADQQDRIASAQALVADNPSLQGIIDAATQQVSTQQANLATALGHLGPIIELINIFAGLIGLPKIAISVDTTGSLRGVATALNEAAYAIKTVRDAIPI